MPADAGRPRIHGVMVGAQGRCAHWNGPGDVVAIRFRCCDRYFACHDCHQALADHPAERWPRADFASPAVLCGACGAQLTVARYLAANARCPVCDVAFNPRCVLHHHLYFEVTTLSGRQALFPGRAAGPHEGARSSTADLRGACSVDTILNRFRAR